MQDDKPAHIAGIAEDLESGVFRNLFNWDVAAIAQHLEQAIVVTAEQYFLGGHKLQTRLVNGKGFILKPGLHTTATVHFGAPVLII